MGSTLYELTEEFLNLLSMAEDPDVDPQAFKDTLEGLEYEVELKADAYAKIIRQVEGNIATVDAEINRLQGFKKLLEGNVDTMKGNLENTMKVTGKTKFKTDLFSFRIQKNPASVVIDNEDDVPPEYLKITPTVNKTAIKKAIESGEDIPYAHLEQSESLRIQ